MLTESQKVFLVQAAQAAVVAERVTGVPAELSVAQCILESAWGTRALPRELWGWETKPADMFIAHGRLLADGAAYKDAWEQYHEDPQHDLDTLIGAIARRYATDPGYAVDVMALAHGPHVTAAIAAARVSHPAVLV